jgi:hypothetical protein
MIRTALKDWGSCSQYTTRLDLKGLKIEWSVKKMKRKITIVLLFLVLYFLVLSSCGGEQTAVPEPTDEVAISTPSATAPAEATPLTEPLYGLANVESLEILTEESTTEEVRVRLRGLLPNGCTEIDEIIRQQEGSVFTLAVSTVQEPGQDCTEALVPFDETITLDVSGLETGSYSVKVNDLEGSFNLDAGDQPPEEPAITPAAPDIAAVSGRVWHDLCAVSGEQDEEPGPGCVTADDGEIQADGLLEDEPGIEGVQVSIGTGDCPAEVDDVVVTDSEGIYVFDDLASGTYCIFIDVVEENNQEILIPGRWTAPEDGALGSTITLSEGESLESIDFGWDYQFLPIPDVDPTTCSNSFEFVQDLNIPDDTVFPPGAEFTKIWLLRNNGTCPWTTDYSIVFLDGDQMSAESTIPLSEPVAPGQELEVAIDMVAPEEPGTYRGNWQVADASDQPFGINGFIEDAFWLRIVVEEDAPPVATPLSNSGTIGGVVWDDFCVNSDPGRGCIEFPEDSGIFVGDGSLNSGESILSEITITLANGACPADGTLPAGNQIIGTSVTDENGLYRFENLPDDTYCVFMDALDEVNVDFLIPGNWTWPGTGVGRYTFILDPGEQALDLDFGWDFAD